MGGTFGRARGGRVKVRLGRADCVVVAGLLEAVSGLLEPEAPAGGDAEQVAGGGEGASTSGPPADDEAALLAQLEADLIPPRPADPAVARLLPDASRDDPELAESFRRLTEPDLRERKRGALALAAAALRRPTPVVLDDSEAQALLKGLTDVRLVLAERLGIQTDEDAEFLHAAIAAGVGDADAAWSQAAGLYDVVTFLQEDLVHTLTP
ncbi:MAG TPA: DUF2017 family protein [Kineosporiaceae bacterium]|nr:DUF2017 family protein [Kineosporiaceae bacterium]